MGFFQHFITLFFLLLLGLVIPRSIQGDPDPEGSVLSETKPEKVRLQLKWKHQFQFAGYYAALEKGYYREAGLDVEIVQAKEGQDTIQEVLEGRAEFGVGTTDLVLLHQKGEPVVVLAVIFQHSPLALLLRKDSGIRTLHGLAGRRVMIEPHSAELFAYLKREGVPLDAMVLPAHTFDTRALQQRQADAMSVYITDEPFALRRAGIPYLLFSPRAAGIDFYGDNLFTTEKEIEDHPERVRRFREASLRGWRYAMQNKEEIIQLIYNKYSRRHSLEHLRFEAKQMELLMPDIVEIGHMYPGRWEHIASVYSELNMMPRDYHLEGFMYDPDPRPDLTWLYLSLGILAIVALGVSAVALKIHRLNLDLRRSEDLRHEAERIIQHDLKSPLSVIIGYTDMLVSDSRDSENLEVYRQIHRSATQMLEMVSRSLDIFEMESGQHRLARNPVDLNQLLQEILAGFSRMARSKDVSLTALANQQPLDTAPACVVAGDGLYLKTMLENLVKNAIEAAPSGTTVSVQLECPLPRPSSGGCRISIHNQGTIPVELTDSFFERYSRGSQSRGSGLGTYSARLIARAHGGDIAFNTDPEKGTELIVTLPAVQK